MVGGLKIAEVAVADHEVLVQPGESGVIGTRAGTRLVNVAVGVGLCVTAVKDEMMPEETRRERTAQNISIVGAIRAGDFSSRYQRGSLGGHNDRCTEGTVTIGGRTHAALNLDASERAGIGIHIGPEDTLVFGRVERYAVEGDVDTGIN